MNELDTSGLGPHQKALYLLTRNEVVRKMDEGRSEMILRAFSGVAPAGAFFSILCSRMMEKAPDHYFSSIYQSLSPKFIELILTENELREYRFFAARHQYTENSSVDELRTFLCLSLYAAMLGKKRAMEEFGSIDFSYEYRDSSSAKKATMFDYVEADSDTPFSWWANLSGRSSTTMSSDAS